MGDGMICSTTKISSGARWSKWSRKAGLLHCSTTPPPKGAAVVVERGGAASLRWRGGGA